MSMRKSQSSMEFVILVGFMLLVIVIFFSIASSRVLKAREDANGVIAEDLAKYAYREIEIAKSVNNGYIRTFSLPNKLVGNNYDIKIVDNKELIVNFLSKEHVLFLPGDVDGNISRGSNKIKKIDGVVHISSE